MDNIDFSRYKYLFLDRDGVINVEQLNDYVKTVEEFVFIDKSTAAIAQFSKVFDRIFIITNQRGIGRGLYSHDDLAAIHHHMNMQIESAGGKIDEIYYCSDLKSSSINRKPNIGMAFQVMRDYPEVDFSKSIFIGNSKSDIEFANKLGMLSVLVGDKYPKDHIIYRIINVYCKNLSKFAEIIENKKTQH